MPNRKNSRKGGQEKKCRRELLSQKALSFHEKTGAAAAAALPRPRTVPDLVLGMKVGAELPDAVVVQERPKLTKLLLNVTIQRSLGAVQVVMPPEATVADLIAAALKQYAKECRRPMVPHSCPHHFDLHYSQFSLESLNREEKLMLLGSRNFFLSPKKAAEAATGDDVSMTTVPTLSCSEEAANSGKNRSSWLRFMEFFP